MLSNLDDARLRRGARKQLKPRIAGQHTLHPDTEPKQPTRVLGYLVAGKGSNCLGFDRFWQAIGSLWLAVYPIAHCCPLLSTRKMAVLPLARLDSDHRPGGQKCVVQAGVGQGSYGVSAGLRLLGARGPAVPPGKTSSHASLDDIPCTLTRNQSSLPACWVILLRGKVLTSLFSTGTGRLSDRSGWLSTLSLIVVHCRPPVRWSQEPWCISAEGRRSAHPYGHLRNREATPGLRCLLERPHPQA